MVLIVVCLNCWFIAIVCLRLLSLASWCGGFAVCLFYGGRFCLLYGLFVAGCSFACLFDFCDWLL